MIVVLTCTRTRTRGGDPFMGAQNICVCQRAPDDAAINTRRRLQNIRLAYPFLCIAQQTNTPVSHPMHNS